MALLSLSLKPSCRSPRKRDAIRWLFSLSLSLKPSCRSASGVTRTRAERDSDPMALLSPHHIGSLSSQTIDIDCLCCQSTGLFVRHDSYSYGERQPVRAVHTSEPVGGSVSRVSRPGFRSSASRWRLPSVALQTKTVFVTAAPTHLGRPDWSAWPYPPCLLGRVTAAPRSSVLDVVRTVSAAPVLLYSVAWPSSAASGGPAMRGVCASQSALCIARVITTPGLLLG